jgi:hypothetical protein
MSSEQFDGPLMELKASCDGLPRGDLRVKEPQLRNAANNGNREHLDSSQIIGCY